MPKRKKEVVKQNFVRFLPEVVESTPLYYANYIQVSHTPYDFSLTFAKIPSPPNADQIATAQSGQHVKIESMMQIAMPLRLVQGLITALSTQKETYEKNYGVIGEPKKNVE